MKRILIFLSLFLPVLGFSSYGITQTVSNNNGTGATTLVMTVASTASGDLLTLPIAYTGVTNSISSVIDNKGNTWNARDPQSLSPDLGVMYDSPNATAGVTTVTVTFANSCVASAIFREYTGVGNAIDKHVSANGTSAAPSSGATATTTSANELVLGWYAGIATGGTPTAGAGFGNLTTNGAVAQVSAIEDLNQTGMATQTATFTITSAKWICGVATYALSPPASIGGLAILGVGLVLDDPEDRLRLGA